MTLGTLLIAFIAYMTIRIWGQGQRFTPFESSFYASNSLLNTGSEPMLIVGWEQNFLLQKRPDLILWVDVYRANNQTILVKPWTDRNKPKKLQEQIATPARPLLKDLLLQFPKTRFVVNCNDNVQDIQIQLAQVIDQAHASERVLLASEYNTILLSTKEISPMIIFGSTVADLTRLKTFESMGLLAAAPFKGDVFFSPLVYHGRAAVDSDIVQEMKRRFKKVILGPLATKEDVAQAKSYQPDGFFIEDPFLILTRMTE